MVIAALNDELSLLQADCDGDSNREKEILGELSVAWCSEELFWKQRSRVNWLKEGDRNSHFFHLSTLHRRHINRITKLLCGEGNWVEGSKDVRCEIDNFFMNLFTSGGCVNVDNVLSCIPHMVTDEQNISLTCPVSCEEVHLAVKQLGSLKAPDPDGFPGNFHEKYWPTMMDTICTAARYFFNGDESLAFLNRTNITLIPKIQNPEKIQQFRPISLCNNTYKILAKILANRLKPLLAHIISQQQNAFLPGRQIQDNLIIAHEAFHYLKLKKTSKKAEMGIKIDMQKAYDRVEWDFLEATLIKMGFCSKWTSMVMKCVQSVSFSVGINGKQGSFFQPSRGLRQGDPLSLYLFLLVSEVLSINVTNAVSTGKLGCIKLSRNCPGLSHLFFADDSLFFIKAEARNCTVLRDIIDQYCRASGQIINEDKSSLIFSANATDDCKADCANALAIPVDNTPGVYLGLPTHWGRSKTMATAYIRERVREKLDGWKTKLLNQAGKEVMIKSVAIAVPSYPLSVFSMPLSLCKAINSDIAHFWWSKGVGNNGMHWRAWDKLCLSKLEGGIGFRDLNAYNLSLLAKQCWRIINNPNALWVQDPES